MGNLDTYHWECARRVADSNQSESTAKNQAAKNYERPYVEVQSL
jgi:hypothetical protein